MCNPRDNSKFNGMNIVEDAHYEITFTRNQRQDHSGIGVSATSAVHPNSAYDGMITARERSE